MLIKYQLVLIKYQLVNKCQTRYTDHLQNGSDIPSASFPGRFLASSRCTCSSPLSTAFLPFLLTLSGVTYFRARISSDRGGIRDESSNWRRIKLESLWTDSLNSVRLHVTITSMEELLLIPRPQPYLFRKSKPLWRGGLEGVSRINQLTNGNPCFTKEEVSAKQVAVPHTCP